MALDWVQVDVGFSRTVAVVMAAHLLGLDRLTFLGHMQELQVWAVQALPAGRFTPVRTSDGRATDAGAEEAGWVRALELGAFWTGERGAFWDALLRAGILLREGEDVRLTTSDRYVQALEKRRKEAERKRLARANKKRGPSGGRPQDVPPQKRRDEMRGEPPTAAAGGRGGASAGRPVPVPPPLPSDVAADALPVQRALPGTHLVPAAPPREERLEASAVAPGAAEGPPDAPPAPEAEPGSRVAAAAFFGRCQAKRVSALRVPSEDMPPGWPDWYAKARVEVGSEERLDDAWEDYLRNDWGRSRKPACSAVAFISKGTWLRHVEPLPDAEETTTAGVDTSTLDTSTDAGRGWKLVVDALEAAGRTYALTWLLKASPVDVVDGEVVMQCPDAYHREWVVGHYGDMVDEVACDVGLEGVRWVVAESSQAASA